MDDSKYFETPYHDGDCECKICRIRRADADGFDEGDEADRQYHIRLES